MNAGRSTATAASARSRSASHGNIQSLTPACISGATQGRGTVRAAPTPRPLPRMAPASRPTPTSTSIRSQLGRRRRPARTDPTIKSTRTAPAAVRTVCGATTPAVASNSNARQPSPSPPPPIADGAEVAPASSPPSSEMRSSVGSSFAVLGACSSASAGAARGPAGRPRSGRIRAGLMGGTGTASSPASSSTPAFEGFSDDATAIGSSVIAATKTPASVRTAQSSAWRTRTAVRPPTSVVSAKAKPPDSESVTSPRTRTSPCAPCRRYSSDSTTAARSGHDAGASHCTSSPKLSPAPATMAAHNHTDWV